MKAWVLHNVGDIRYEEVARPVPGPDDVLVKVRAAGICGSDIPRIYRDGAHRMPLVPGHEFSGQVVEVPGASMETWLHKRVGIFPLIPCHNCVPCHKGYYEMCRQYSYLGSRQDGGYAEYVCVPAANVMELPKEVTYEQAAMLEPMAVAAHAMRRVPITQDDAVVVCGLGTIGMLLTMLLMERGVRNLYVIGNKDLQMERALSLGLSKEQYFDSRKGDARTWIAGHTDGDGADVFFECVGKAETMSLAMESSAPAGRVCLVGNPHTDMTLMRDAYWKILRNQLTVIGTWNSSFQVSKEGWKPGSAARARDMDDWQYVMELLRRGRIHPERFISHRLDMEHLDEGFHIMRDKSEDYLKIMSYVRDPSDFQTA